MNDINKATNNVEALFRDEPELGQLCLDIISHVQSDSTAEKLYFDTFQRLAGNDAKLALRALQYLTGTSYPVLSIRFELTESRAVTSLSTDQVRDAMRKGALIHPATGEEISDFMHRIVVYFVPQAFANLPTLQ